jgi:hypothetical protein
MLINMDIINIMHRNQVAKNSDINEHLETLRKYASKCGTVAEMGVRTPVSTWAFLAGLIASAAPTKTLYCVDIEPVDMELPKALASQAGINLQFLQENSATVKFETDVDLLFIDTWHVYGHLKRELDFHNSRVAKYIIMHDTTLDAVGGESLRCSMDVHDQVTKSGYSLGEICKGLAPALNEFLETHPEWHVEAKYENCNGLTILARS